MNNPGRLLAIGLLLLPLAFAGTARAQYMYLDTNGDGIHDSQDQIDKSAPTYVDIWIDTAANRDGTPTVCDVDGTTPISIFSWEVVLRAVGGTFEWGPLDNLLPLSSTYACFADAADTTDPVWYHNGWGGYLRSSPGRYRLARLRVQVKSGDPGIAIMPQSQQPADLTSFGTMCEALDGDNTYKLGYDWFDAEGIGDLAADAGGPYLALPDVAIQFHSDATISPAGHALTYAWDFGDGAASTQANPIHAYASAGQYAVTFTVTDGNRTDAGSTVANIVAGTAPTAKAGGPYQGRVGTAILFDGRHSSDPNGDPLTYSWDFGNGTGATGNYVFHTYYESRIYSVKLTVSDGDLMDSDITSANIDPRPERPPVAETGGPYTGTAGSNVHFNGGASSDPDNDPLTFLWIFGDGYQSASMNPQHAYTEQGEYEVILEVSDGTLATSSATTASIGPTVGVAPVAVTGGPYQGAVGVPIIMDARASSDPDHDALEFTWDFGDVGQGRGAIVTHIYIWPGTYSIHLTVSDGGYSTGASTVATVSSQAEARAFLSGGESLALGSTEAYQTIGLEPIEGSFAISAVEIPSIALIRTDADGSGRIMSVAPGRIGQDADGNGVKEISVAFRREDLRHLMGTLARPSTMKFALVGSLWGNGALHASLECLVIPAQGRFAAVVRPNPFNPQATVTFVTSKEGRVTAHVFNMNGRLVRTLLHDASMSAGRHELSLDARSDGGTSLPSGVYFLKIDGPDGAITTRIAVAK